MQFLQSMSIRAASGKARGVDRRIPFWVLIAVLLTVSLVLAGPANARRSRRAAHGHAAHSHARKHGGVRALAAMGAEPNPSIFGLSVSVYDSSHSNFAADFGAAHQLGARFTQFTAGPQTAGGHYEGLDWEVKQARRDGMGVLLSMGGIPGACSLHPRPADIHACPPTTSGDLDAYGNYVRRFLIHFRNVVQYYESWTEPNNSSSWARGPDAGGYAALLKVEYSAMESVNRQYHAHLQLLFASPSGFSVEPGTPGWMAVLPYTQRVLKALHGVRPFDGVALHAYRFPPGGYGPSTPAYDYVGGVPVKRGAQGPFPGAGCNSTPWCEMTWAQELAAYEQEFATHGYGDPALWVTEFGWPGNLQAAGDYYPSESEQESYLVEAYQDLLQLPFVKAALWFNVRDYQPGFLSGDPEYFYHYGLLQYGFAEKPAATAFQGLAKANPLR